MQLRISRTIALMVGSISMQAIATASAVSYKFTGNLTGSIGSTALNGNSFTFVFFGDTTSITLQSSLGGPTSVNPATSNSISILGIGSGSFVDAIVVMNFMVRGVPNFQDNTTLSGFLTGVNSAAAGWDLASSIGPLALSPASAGGSFNTSFGTLNLASISNLTFVATVTAAGAPPAIPTLSTWAMLLTVLFLLGLGLWQAPKVARN